MLVTSVLAHGLVIRVERFVVDNIQRTFDFDAFVRNGQVTTPSF